VFTAQGSNIPQAAAEQSCICIDVAHITVCRLAAACSVHVPLPEVPRKVGELPQQ
jgi:hypothetical protein